MKTHEIAGTGLAESLLGGDSSVVDVVRVEDGKYEAYLKSSEDENPIAVMRIEDGVIVELTIDEEATSSEKSDVTTAMVKALCKDADKSNVPIVVPVDAMVGGTKAIRFMQSFGFVKNDEYLERRPGSALPYSVIL